MALERIITRATEPEVPEHFALAAAPRPPLPAPWHDRAGEEIGGLIAMWLRDDATHRSPVLVAAPQP